MNASIRNRFIRKSEYLATQLTNENDYDSVIIPDFVTEQMMDDLVNNNINADNFADMANMAQMLVITYFWAGLKYLPTSSVIDAAKEKYPHLFIPEWISQYHISLLQEVEVNETYLSVYEMSEETKERIVIDACKLHNYNVIDRYIKHSNDTKDPKNYIVLQSFKSGDATMVKHIVKNTKYTPKTFDMSVMLLYAFRQNNIPLLKAYFELGFPMTYFCSRNNDTLSYSPYCFYITHKTLKWLHENDKINFNEPFKDSLTINHALHLIETANIKCIKYVAKHINLNHSEEIYFRWAVYRSGFYALSHYHGTNRVAKCVKSLYNDTVEVLTIFKENGYTLPESSMTILLNQVDMKIELASPIFEYLLNEGFVVTEPLMNTVLMEENSIYNLPTRLFIKYNIPCSVQSYIAVEKRIGHPDIIEWFYKTNVTFTREDIMRYIAQNNSIVVKLFIEHNDPIMDKTDESFLLESVVHGAIDCVELFHKSEYAYNIQTLLLIIQDVSDRTMEYEYNDKLLDCLLNKLRKIRKYIENNMINN
jgi:hypothetical protein